LTIDKKGDVISRVSTSFDLIVRGGTVVTEASAALADLAVTAGKIAAIAAPGVLDRASQEIDATGRLVMPGGVDPHVHAEMHLGEFTTLDDFETATMAAAMGGTTTIVDFAIPQPRMVQSPAAAADARAELASGAAVVDVGFHAAVAHADETALEQLPGLAEKGLTTVKMFTIYRDLVMLPLDEVHETLRVVRDTGTVALVHAESPHIVEPLVKRLAQEGRLSPADHAQSRPPESELDMVRSLILLLEMTGAAGYIVHVSTPEAAREIMAARAAGVKVWAETCPHYVFLDDSCYNGPDGELYVCSPPIRDRNRMEQLWDLVRRGGIQVWGSDHCCYDRTQKAKYRDNFPLMPNGLPGIETRCPLLFSEGVGRGALTPSQFAALTAANPARLNGLYPRKGTLQVGGDADLAIYDPDVEKVIGRDTLHMQTDYSPFDGWRVSGWPTDVVSRGSWVVRDGRFVGRRGAGEVLAAHLPEQPW
jgi:dihydropyrimidinase